MSELHAPNGRRRPTSSFTTRQHLGDCVECRRGIFQGDDISRGYGQVLGALHTECLRQWEKRNGVSK